MEEIEHGLHPSTYLPRTQVPETGNFGSSAPCPNATAWTLIIDQWKRERPELDPSPIGIVGRVSRLARELEERLEPVYREHGLEGGWHDVLATLRRHGPPYRLRPTDLTDATMLTSSGTTKRLDKLEQKGLIAREPDPKDRRGVLIALTDEGPRGDRRHDRGAPGERAPAARRAERRRAAPARRPAAQAPARAADSDRDQALHRPGVPVRVLGRAEPVAAALALRRPAHLAADDDRADAASRARRRSSRRARRTCSAATACRSTPRRTRGRRPPSRPAGRWWRRA